ncbi:MAG: hypothetical protein ACTHKQ_02210 [Mesorhizobium sp.]
MNFPNEWQEVIRYASSGEKHIADIRTEDGLTIEFQNSYLRPDERVAREDFYGDMVWVANGLRLVRDLPRFESNVNSLRSMGVNGIYVHRFPAEIFSRSWLDCKAPVYFDFGEPDVAIDSNRASSRFLWGLLPQRILDHAIVLRIPRKQFIHLAIESPKLLLGHTILPRVESWLPGDLRRRERQSVLEWRRYLEQSYPAKRKRLF